MWTTVAVAASLWGLAASDQDLKIAHARFTYGMLGMERTNTTFLAPDFIWLSFDIDNLSRDRKTGKFVYSVVLDCLNSKGKRVFGHDDPNIEEIDALGGSTLATYVWVQIGRDTAPGKYTLRLNVTDKVAKKKATWKHDFTIRNKVFGFSRVSVQAVGIASQPTAVLFYVQGFQKNAKKLPNLGVRIRIFDEKRDPTLVRPIIINIPKDLAEGLDPTQLTEVPLQTEFRLSRPGRFTILLEAEDRQAKKSIELRCKITVLDPRKFESPK
jgi:hypothetical protein